MGRLHLVVANHTLGGSALARQLDAVIEAEPDARFHLLVPLRTPSFVACDPVMASFAAAEWDTAHLVLTDAEERTQRLLDWLHQAGADATGTVVLLDPLAAVDRALKARPADAIIVSTLPRRFSRWLRMDLPRRVQRFGLPVTTVVNERDGEALPPPRERALAT
jgi:hypothetical protein